MWEVRHRDRLSWASVIVLDSSYDRGLIDMYM
jgi:hypothetical protein